MLGSFVVGATSFVLPDFALPNAEWLAGKIADIQLLLLEPDGDLPTAADIARMAELSARYDLTYSVHMPSIVVESSAAEESAALEGIVRLARLAAPLSPSHWVFHVEPGPPDAPAALERWVAAAALKVEEIAARTGLPLAALEVENQSVRDLESHRRIVDRAGCSMCLDVGHVLAAGGDPCEAARRHHSVASHLHLHGLAGRDHASLEYFPHLDRFVGTLVELGYTGLVTLEVFGRESFERSMLALRRARSARV